MPRRDLDESWAPVPIAATIRALFAVVAAKDFEIHKAEIKAVFLNEKMEKELYIKLPEGVRSGEAGMSHGLNLALYGTKKAGRMWRIQLDNELKEMVAALPMVYPRLRVRYDPVHGLVYILVDVDALLVAAKSPARVKVAKAYVAAKFDAHDMDEVTDFSGMKVTCE